MASDLFKVKRHERSDRQKYMENKFARSLEGSESIMKFSPQRLESPPPKPPRRRHSDQLSVPSLGAYSSAKKSDENQRCDPVLKQCPKPAYQSLPANLTSDVLPECEDSSNLFSKSFSSSDQLKHSDENEVYKRSFFDNLKVYESGTKESYGSNKLSINKNFPSVFPEANKACSFSKYHCEHFIPGTPDTLSRNPMNNNKIFMTCTLDNQNLKSSNKECHRRHHSDPVISHFNIQGDSSMQFSCEQYCDSTSYSTKKDNKHYDSGDSCCRKSFFVMQEMRILKEINNKLWQHLCSLQTCLENMKKKAYDECTDVSISGLLSSIYYAQKTKDSAMEERLKLALDEKDAAVCELEELIHMLSKRFDYADGEKEVDKDIKELLEEMGCTTNSSKFLKYQRMLLCQIQSFKESKQDSFSHKLKQAAVERDNALEKVKVLEEEIKDLKLCFDLWHSDNKHWEFTIFDIINQVMHQRDSLLSKSDNGFDIGNVIYRPLAIKKIDSLEHQNVSYESQSKTIESLKSHQSMHLGDMQQHPISTSEEILKLKEEIIVLNKVLEGERKKREHSEEKCFRLERLIHILRKKLNGQNIGVPV